MVKTQARVQAKRAVRGQQAAVKQEQQGQRAAAHGACEAPPLRIGQAVTADQIKTIVFKRNVQLQKYEHAHIEATAEVLPGQDPSRVMAALRSWVGGEIARTKAIYRPAPLDMEDHDFEPNPKDDW